MELKYDLTISMIVKNEEKNLEKCLKSLEPLRKQVNCELIITDTGSTDKTIEISKKYADKLLEFDWCDDFSQARNVGVDASEGKWFMFIDADEVFDKSISEIIKFFKSPDHNKYNSATFVQRNAIQNNKNKYNDFQAPRLFNFNNGKRHFIFKIHEAIPVEGRAYQIGAIAWHTGYHEDVFKEKRIRNRNLLEKELEKEPNNLRYIKQIMDISEDEEEINELGNRAIKLFKNKEANNPEVVLSIYTFLTRNHLKNQKYDNVIEISNEFFALKTKDNKSLPHMEMAWLNATAAMNLNKTVDALRKFELYKLNYEYLSQNKLNMFSSSDVYTTNKESIYHHSCVMIVECLRKIGEANKANKLLETLDCYKLKNDNEYYLLNLYLKNVILLNNQKLFKKVENFVTRAKIDIYSNEKHVTVMVGKMHFNNDISDFIKNCNKETFAKIFVSLIKTFEEFTQNIYNHFVKKSKFVNNKECEYYTEAMYIYCRIQMDILNPKADREELENAKSKIKSNLLSSGLFANIEVEKPKTQYKQIFITQKLNKIFELLIKYNYDFLNKTQNIEKLKETGLENIDQMQAMTITIYDGLKNKNESISKYIEALKNSLPYARHYTKLIELEINLINEENKNANKESEINFEGLL